MRDRVLEELNAHLRAEDEHLEKLPKCALCGEPIQDGYVFEINGETLCEDCLNDNYRRPVEDYLD